MSDLTCREHKLQGHVTS